MINFMIEDNIIKIDEGTRRISKDDMNIVELPFTLLSNRNPKNHKTFKRVWKGKGENGKEREFYKIITGSDEWGLPTFITEELYVACMELSYRQGFEKRKVYTTQYEIIKLLGWPDNGGSYNRLIKAFNQLGGVWITTNAFWDNKEKKYRKLGFGIIDDYMFFEEEKKGRKSKYYNDQMSFPFGNFNWNEKFFEHSLQKGYIKTLNVGKYFSLTNNISKRLYRYADKKLYNQQLFEIDIFRLAFDKLEMVGNSYKQPSKIIQNLKPAITELKERGIVDIEIKKSTTESGYKACFKSIKKSNARTSSIIQEKKEGNKPDELIKYFHNKIDPENANNHISTPKETTHAETLLSKHTEKEIKYIIDYAIKKAEETNFQMQHFGAVMDYTEKAITDLNFKKDKKEKEKTAKEENRLKGEYQKYKDDLINNFIHNIPSEKYQQELEKISQEFDEENTFLKDKKESFIYQSSIESKYINKQIQTGKIKFLPFEGWKSRLKET